VINRKKDGSLYTEAMNIAPVRNPAGEVVNFIATKQDVTKRKSMEAQLLQAAKMEAIGRLAGGVAHDFNNLLTIISGYGQLLRERLSPQDLGHVEEILKASDRAAALTRQLLAFSRRQILAPQVLDLNSIVANLEKMLRRLIGEDIELTTVKQSALGRVKADPGQIEQVIINLAVNARDAMPQGGKLTIETANVKLDETYARSHAGITPGPHVMLAVSDTGLGMDPETLGSIFEPFFTTKEKGKGTGLGLATVYGIVKQSAGSIWVYSEPGQGTTCKIYLPCIEEPMPEAEPAKVRAELAKGSETILVVEDEEGVRSLVCETLKSKGYNVLDARGPSEALTIVEHYVEPIHMLLTDVVMPQMSGKELAKRLSTVRPGAKVLYMSGYTDDAIVRHGVLEAGTSFLQKPFVPSILLRKVREVLDTKRKDD
jgi:signal transduction histidine kinase/ActR/RegA family two-component response regulator